MEVVVANKPQEFHAIEVPDDYYLTMDEFKARKRERLAVLKITGYDLVEEAKNTPMPERLKFVAPICKIEAEIKRITRLAGPMVRDKYADLVADKIAEIEAA